VQQQATQTAAPPKPGAEFPFRSTGGMRRLLDTDFSRPLPALLLGIGFVASRLPWVGLGYGADPDAWRVAMSARYLLAHAAYLPSRLPGYPVHDIAMAALIWGGWTLTNLATVAISLVGVLIFARIVRRFSLPLQAVLVLTFAFLPLTWSTSTATLDYSWALTFLLGAYLSVLDRRPLVAGVLLGLAGGCRISSLVFALPLLLLLLPARHLAGSNGSASGGAAGGGSATLLSPSTQVSADAARTRRAGGLRLFPATRYPLPAVTFLVATAVTWIVVFAPVWLRYGTQFWNFYDVRPSWGDFAHALTEQSVGLAPLVVAVVALACSWPRLRRLPALLRSDPQVAAWAMIVLLTLFIYVRLPLQTYYLMPAAPFALLLLSRVLRPRLLLVVCVALVLGGFIDFYTTSPSGWRSPSALLHIRPQRGLVLQDYSLRQDRLALVRNLRQLQLPEHSVITTGFYFPMVAELYHSQLQLTLPEGYLFQVGPLTDNARASDNRDVVYVWLLAQGDARTLIRQGYTIDTLDFSRETRRPLVTRIYLPENERFGIH
jgi:hypothetical protein